MNGVRLLTTTTYVLVTKVERSKDSKGPRRQCHFVDYFGASFTVGRSAGAASGSYVYEWALTGPGRMASTRVVGAWSIAGERVNSTSPPLAGW